MKKTVSIGILFFCTVMIFAASYADNQYQRLAEGYTARAQEAFDSGEYDLAVEYTIKAEENAELSRAYIELMLARADADTQIRVARNRLVWARSIKADVNYPDKYNASSQKIETAQASFAAAGWLHPCKRSDGFVVRYSGKSAVAKILCRSAVAGKR